MIMFNYIIIKYNLKIKAININYYIEKRFKTNYFNEKLYLDN